MSSAKLTLIGAYNYYNIAGQDLFEGLELPEGIDKETLVNNILLRGGEFEVIYGDYVFIKGMVSTWSKKWNRTFTKWIEALNIEFSPLENYDRVEEWTDTTTASAKGSDSSSNNGTVNKEVSAFDSNQLQPDSSDVSSIFNNAETSTDSESNSIHSARIHGNIGVTTSTQMLEDYLRVEAWNIYEQITDVFLQEFVIPLY